MDLVQDHQPIQPGAEIKLRLGQSRPVAFGFEIQIQCIPFSGHLHCQGRLPHLARAKQHHGRSLVQSPHDLGLHSSFNHTCDYGISIHVLQGYKALVLARLEAKSGPTSTIRPIQTVTNHACRIAIFWIGCGHLLDLEWMLFRHRNALSCGTYWHSIGFLVVRFSAGIWFHFDGLVNNDWYQIVTFVAIHWT